MNSYDLWPKSSVSFVNCSNSRSIEDKLFTFWNSGYPVLTSSARVSIVLALKNNKISRKDYVDLTSFISPCVVKSVSTQAMPNYENTKNSHSEIIYHQYGYLQDSNRKKNLIEDSVDTLCLPNTELFPSGGRYEIWSLPKIFGTSAGSIIWCKNKEDAETIRQYRDNFTKYDLYQWALRVLGQRWVNFYYYWEGSELYHGGGLPNIAMGDIYKKISNLDNIIEDRLKKIDNFKYLISKEVVLSKGRLPCLIPLLNVNHKAKLKLKDLGFNLSDRYMQISRKKNVNFFPLPIHQDVPLKRLFMAEKILLENGF
jgi:putative PLP-dependent aminotransferase (TIGR04422 family)